MQAEAAQSHREDVGDEEEVTAAEEEAEVTEEPQSERRAAQADDAVGGDAADTEADAALPPEGRVTRWLEELPELPAGFVATPPCPVLPPASS